MTIPEFTELEYGGLQLCGTRAILEFVELGYCICKITQYSSPPNSSIRHTQLGMELELLIEGGRSLKKKS